MPIPKKDNANPKGRKRRWIDTVRSYKDGIRRWKRDKGSNNPFHDYSLPIC